MSLVTAVDPEHPAAMMDSPASVFSDEASMDRNQSLCQTSTSVTEECGAESSSEAIQTRDRLLKGCDELKLRLIGLLDSKGKVAEEIHAIRKLGKSLRGGFCLFRLEKSSALEIQAIGRLLSEPRDAVSRYSTWKKLNWTEDPILSAAIDALLGQQTHSAARRPPPETIAWCLARVDAATARLRSLPAKGLEARAARGNRKLERKAVSRCRKLDDRVEESFHEARKALKAWAGAIGFMALGTTKTGPILCELTENLGDENDLATLSAWLERHGFTRHFASGLLEHIASERRRIQHKVIGDCRRLRRQLSPIAL